MKWDVKWLNRIFGKEEEVEIPATVAFDEIDTWLKEVAESLFRSLHTSVGQLYEEISEISKQLLLNIATLQTAESSEDVPDRIVKIGLLSRDRMVNHLYSVVEKLEVPTQTDYKTVLFFYRTAMSHLEFPLGKSEKSIYAVRSLFPAEIKAIIAELNRLKACLNRLITPLKGQEGKIEKLERVPRLIQDIKELWSEIKKEKKYVRDQEEELYILEERIDREIERLRSIDESEEWQRFKAFETELSVLKRDLNALESDVHRLFSPLNKALTLLKKQDETGRHKLMPNDRIAIASILSSPVHALNEDITGYLRTIKAVIEANPAILKDRKRETALKWLDHLLNLGLSSIREKCRELHVQIEEINGELSGLTVLKDKEEIERRLLSAQRQQVQLQERIARSKRHIVSIEGQLRENEQVLSAALEELTGKEIEVRFK
ncbi:MAG: hypothetical protein H0M93_01980 [Methanophagales archaeon]|nr:hypothetical protein [Methanophagales archaeon]